MGKEKMSTALCFKPLSLDQNILDLGPCDNSFSIQRTVRWRGQRRRGPVVVVHLYGRKKKLYDSIGSS